MLRSLQSGRATAIAFTGLFGAALLIGALALRPRIFGGSARAATHEEAVQTAAHDTLNELLAHDEADAAICKTINLTWRELFSRAENFTNPERNEEVLTGLREWIKLESQYASTDFLRPNLQQRLTAADLPLTVSDATLRTWDDRFAPVAAARSMLYRERSNALYATQTAYEYARDHVCKHDSQVIYLDHRQSVEFFRERLDQAQSAAKSLVPLERQYESARASLLASYGLSPKSAASNPSR